jgi:hypothetical protein
MKEIKPKINFNSKIQEQLEHDHVKMRSKWVFFAEKLGLESGLMLSILVGVLLLSFILYVMEKNGAFEFTEFGYKGLAVIFDNIPYDLVIITVLFFILANFILKQFDFSYKKPFYIFSCGVLIIISALGVTMMCTGVDHSVFDSLANLGIIKNLYADKIINAPQGDKGVIGRVVGVGTDSLLVQTPQGKLIQVEIVHQEPSVQYEVGQGQIIKMVGQQTGEVFQAQTIIIVKDGKTYYFRTMPTPVPPQTISN